MIAAGVMLALAAIPGSAQIFLPALLEPRWAPSDCAHRSWLEAAELPAKVQETTESLEDLLKLDELSLEVGYGLVPLVDTQQGGQLLPRVRALRNNLALQLGFIVPPVHITDNLRLKPREYVIALRGVGDGALGDAGRSPAGHQLRSSPAARGRHTNARARFWRGRVVDSARRQNQALASGYAVVDQTSVLATHLAEVIKQHAEELLTRQEAKRLLDRLADSQPKLVEELVPKLLSLGEVQKVLQQLLREQVSIRDLPTILETLLDAAVSPRSSAAGRGRAAALGRALVRPLLSDDGACAWSRLIPASKKSWDEPLVRKFRWPRPLRLAAFPRASRLEDCADWRENKWRSASPVLLCSTPARFHLKRLLEPFLPKAGGAVPGRDSAGSAVQASGPRSAHGRERGLDDGRQPSKPIAAWQDEEEREQILLEQLPQVRYIARRIHERLPRHVPLWKILVHAGVAGIGSMP